MSDEPETPPNDTTPQGSAAKPATSERPAAGDANRSSDTKTAGADEGAEISPAQLTEIIKALQTEVDTWRDHALRARAETENVRKRLEREKEDLAKYAIAKFARDVVGIGDNFQRALSAIPSAATEDATVKGIADGVSMIEREFIGVLGRHGVQKIDPLGEAFNPHRHQAVMENEDRNVAPGTVVQVFQCGYLLEDRVLRPAMVVVARGGSAATAGEARPAASEPLTSGNGETKPDEA